MATSIAITASFFFKNLSPEADFSLHPGLCGNLVQNKITQVIRKLANNPPDRGNFSDLFATCPSEGPWSLGTLGQRRLAETSTASLFPLALQTVKNGDSLLLTV
jgi:hypothetical protein